MDVARDRRLSISDCSVGLPVAYLFIKAFGNGFHAFWVEVTKPNAIAALKLSAEVALIAVPGQYRRRRVRGTDPR